MSKVKLFAIWTMLLISAACLVLSLGQPLWKMRMEAPQYRDEEALRVSVYPNSMRGDLAELKTLNQYIGVHIPETLPQFRWLPEILIAGGLVALVAGLLPKRVRMPAMLAAPLLLSIALGFAVVQAQRQMHDIGHNRDEKTVMRGVKDFTPPFLGTTKIAQFEVSSRLGVGAYLVGGALVLQCLAVYLSRSVKADSKPRPSKLETRISVQQKEALA